MWLLLYRLLAKIEYRTRKLLFPISILIFVLAVSQNQTEILQNFTQKDNDNNLSSLSSSSITSNRLSIQNECNNRIVSKNTLCTETQYDTNTITKPRIAIISSFLQGEQSNNRTFADFDHLINKACYAKLWGYDFILNMTYGFDNMNDEEERNGDDNGAYWLNYGTWHRVPHIKDRINDYDWILYTDIDYIINVMKYPLESFFKTWELHGMNPSVLIPKDFDDTYYTFSAFAVLIKNDAFGCTVLDHWMEFSRGLCPNGNFAATKRPYTWIDSDQPGIWYALTQTHKEFFPVHDSGTSTPICNETTGLINTKRAYGYEMNQYFKSVQAVIGSDGSDLLNVPIEQPIIWSRPNAQSMTGLGMQLKWGKRDTSSIEAISPQIFAFHRSNTSKWLVESKISLDLCKQVHGCYARYNNRDKLEVGCNGIEYTVAQ